VEDLPRVLDPEGGIFSTANQDLNHLGRRSPINFPMGDHRARQITAALEALPKVSLADMQALQMDSFSLHAREFLAAILADLPHSTARTRLESWDCCYTVDSTEACLFEDFYREFRAGMLSPVLGAEVRSYLDQETGIFIDFSCLFDPIILDSDAPWWEGLDRSAILAAALQTAAALPTQRWGERNRVVMSHILFGGKLPRWMGFDRGPIELAGSRGSVHQGQVYRSGGRDTSFAPSWRFITDMGEAAAYTSLPGGASDRRFSRLYLSDLERWKAGELKRLAPSD
jgi:penicillin amidase